MPRNPAKIWARALWRGTRLLLRGDDRQTETRLLEMWSRAIEETLRAKHGTRAREAIDAWHRLTPNDRVARMQTNPRSFAAFRGTIMEALGSLRQSPGLPPS